MPEQGFQRCAAGRVEKMKEKSIFDHIDGLMLIVKKLGQLVDQKDERIKELSRKLQASSSKPQAAATYCRASIYSLTQTATICHLTFILISYIIYDK